MLFVELLPCKVFQISHLWVSTGLQHNKSYILYIVKAFFIHPDYRVPSNQEKQLASGHTGQSKCDGVPVWLFLALSSIMWNICIYYSVTAWYADHTNKPDMSVCIKRTQQLVKRSASWSDWTSIEHFFFL